MGVRKGAGVASRRYGVSGGVGAEDEIRYKYHENNAELRLFG